MVRARADLHSHSTMSDGVFSPTQLVEMATQVGLGGLALTDHDTVDGLEEFMNADAPDYLQRVSGIEISTELDNWEAHILGYFVNRKSQKLIEQLDWLERARKERIPKMISKLDKLGVHIYDEQIERALQGVSSPGRPHLARLLVEIGAVEDMSKAFSKYLGVGKPAYVKKERMKSTNAVRLLREIGAVPVLAHPYTIRTDDLQATIQELHDAGLLGIEVEYDYSHLHLDYDTDIERIRTYAEEFDLIPTGGSDFHGPDWAVNLGDVTVPTDVIDRLRQASRYR